MTPKVSVILPVLEDEGALSTLFGQIPADPRLDVIVVDGGGSPGIDSLARSRPDVRLVRSRAGRARQMNAGAAVARGKWLLFLHADSRLPAGWIDALDEHSAGSIGGWFQFALDDRAWQARWIEAGVRLRTRWVHLPYGDQGIFVRRDVFAAIGGYDDIPLMEDVEIIRRLRAAGPMVELPLAIVTSARRWRRDGWFRRSARNLLLVTLYFAGVPPEQLSRWYSR